MRKRLAPYLLIVPGGVWLALFFLVPLLVMLSVSTQTGNIEDGFSQTFHFQNYVDGIKQYAPQLLRSLEYGTIATLAALLIAYPMAYWIAFYGGRNKSTFLLLLLLPFFVSFVVRTLSWEFLLADQGIILGPLKDLGVLPNDFHVLATPFAVICGLTYNFLPFMALPLYVGLERLDRRVVEAAQDLYASKTEVFRKVILPLSMPGVLAGVMLTFIPASADFINASILGGPSTTMIGNIIQTLFLNNFDYPLASALGFVVMAVLLLAMFLYARRVGTDELKEFTT
ncbi:MAG: spermidine/putrescine transport system permease protein [Actinomycetota bacterium]|nr:spermidine/putrescine transport system permease protein [Actinomycetota bacterium]